MLSYDALADPSYRVQLDAINQPFEPLLKSAPLLQGLPPMPDQGPICFGCGQSKQSTAIAFCAQCSDSLNRSAHSNHCTSILKAAQYSNGIDSRTGNQGRAARFACGSAQAAHAMRAVAFRDLKKPCLHLTYVVAC